MLAGNGESCISRKAPFFRYALNPSYYSSKYHRHDGQPTVMFRCSHSLLISSSSQTIISLLYTLSSCLFLFFKQRPMARIMDVMLDVVIFVVNIVPISYTIGVYGPMQYVVSKYWLPFQICGFLRSVLSVVWLNPYTRMAMLTPDWSTGGRLVGLILPVTTHSLGDGKLLAW